MSPLAFNSSSSVSSKVFIASSNNHKKNTMNKTKNKTTKKKATRPTQSLSTSISSPPPPPPSSSSSWRSVGWKPLSYPLAALFHTNLVAMQSDPSFLDNDRQNQREEEEEEENKTMATMRLNPFFPLHKTVLVAALRELFLLDGVMDPHTFKVVLSSPQDVPVGKRKVVEGTQGQGTKDEQRDCHFIAVEERITDSTSSMSATTTDTTTTATTTTGPTTPATTTSGLHFGENKKKRKRIHVVLQEEPHATKTKHQQQQQQHQHQQRQKLAAILNDNFKQGVSCGENSLESSGEDFVQLVVEDMLSNHYLQGHVFVDQRSFVSNGSSKISTASISTSSIGSNSSSSSSYVSSGKRDDQDNHGKTTSMGNIPRIRKVSDVSLDHDDDDDNRTFHPFAAHVAVVAFNLLSERTTVATTTNTTAAMGIRDDLEVFGNATRNGIDIDSISLPENIMPTFPGAERLLLHGGGDNTTNASLPSTRSSSGSYNGRDHEKLLQFLYHTQQLPDMLDLSILLETYLRNVALSMVRRCFPIYASDKALREFMGYKSATATRMERVLEILADYLFDVSHAMFAWEKTEIDCFGNKEDPDALSTWNHVTASRDEAICRMLFDERSLTKIGGFDPDSLLYHTVSIKSLESKNISWQKFAKSQRGKKMFSHHDDTSTRIKAGMKRRAKRMKNNIMTCRYRSSSVISNNEEEERYNKNDERLLGMGLVESDLIPITISREEGKSWGILLAKEDSMCVVMRAPDDSKLSVGDLIVSIRDNKFKSVNIPTTVRDFDTSSHDWFSNTIDIFKKSNMLHLEVRRVPILAIGRKTHDG